MEDSRFFHILHCSESRVFEDMFFTFPTVQNPEIQDLSLSLSPVFSLSSVFRIQSYRGFSFHVPHCSESRAIEDFPFTFPTVQNPELSRIFLSHSPLFRIQSYRGFSFHIPHCSEYRAIVDFPFTFHTVQNTELSWIFLSHSTLFRNQSYEDSLFRIPHCSELRAIEDSLF